MNIKQFYLMHKNFISGVISVNSDTGKLEAFEVVDKDHIPLGHKNKVAFSNWWERRAIPKHQSNSEILLEGKPNLVYMMENWGLSLTDCYWINPMNSRMTWDDVNLYENNFAEKDFAYNDLANSSPFKPSATTQGELQKRWVIINNERYLIKGNYADMYRQSLNEVFASEIHRRQGVSYVDYKQIELPTSMGEGIGCISKNFTTSELEFIPAYDVTFFSQQPNDISVFQHYIDTCSSLGINKNVMQKSMDYMILSDFLLTNTDRHLLNLGVLRDPDLLNFVKPAPYFDTGNSMFYNTKYNLDHVFDIQITSFYKTELKFLSVVKNRKAIDLDKVPDPAELGKYYDKDPYAVVYLDNMKQGYEKKIELIDAFQKGYSLNPRSNNFYIPRGNKGMQIDSEDDIDIEK